MPTVEIDKLWERADSTSMKTNDKITSDFNRRGTEVKSDGVVTMCILWDVAPAVGYKSGEMFIGKREHNVTVINTLSCKYLGICR